MSGKGKSRKSLVVFYLLIGYILAQISWWIYQIIAMSKQMDDSASETQGRMRMLAGEFAVFFVLLCLGLFYIHRVFKRELELSTRKKNFSLSITHELKTPITTTKLFVESLMNHGPDMTPDKRNEIYHKIYSEQTRLNELIEKVLLSARMENAQINLSCELCNITELLRDAVLKMQVDQEISLDLEADLKAKVDEFYFRSIIQNLVENASKYSPPDSIIKIKLQTSGKFAILRVIDQGMGIKVEDKTAVFEMYQRLESEETKETKGTGLGLYIVKQLVKAHKGKITVEDNPDGIGSVFTVYIPLLT